MSGVGEALQITNLAKAFKDGKGLGDLKVYEEFGLTLPERAITCIMGPSGCGKTTLLNLISGILKPDTGELRGFTGKAVSYLFQEPRLLPWKTVWQNVDFVIRDVYPQKQRAAMVNKYLRMVNLSDFGHYWPEKLSGGMKQRVSIARAFVFPSDLLLMDEPFKGLDLQLKISLIESFAALWEQDHRTVIFVTHEPDEALYLGDKVYVLGGLPAKVNKSLPVTVPRYERRYGDGKLKELREELLACPSCG
jgi:NitT/TauT family transport system ATP-binding protein